MNGRQLTRGRRKLLTSLVLGAVAPSFLIPFSKSHNFENSAHDSSSKNPLLWSVAWSATAAEYGALYYQAFNLAKFRVDLALKREDVSKPLAIITDLDNTIVHAASYWGYLINQGIDFFDDVSWDRWIPKNLITAAPGALDFLTHCHRNSVEVFYATNRDQGDKTLDYVFNQLNYLNFPFSDKQHVTVYRDTSDKTPTREAVSKSHELVVMLGDNLNDYKRDYYVDDIDERYAIMTRDREDFGNKFIVLPNATDGHWVRAIFGDSEPAGTADNLRILQEAATRAAWNGL